MKKALCLLLVLLMPLTAFAGCKEETPQSSSNATQTSEGENTEQRVINGVYASCGNYVYTIRTTANACITFYLMTEKPLPKDAAITVDTESEYWFKIKDQTPENANSGYTDALGLWIEHGVDFDKYFDMAEKKQLLQEEYSAGKMTKEEYDEAVKDISAELARLADLSWEIRDRNKKKPAPYFFYQVELYVKHRKDEVIRECQLVAGDMSRPIQIGEVTQLYELQLGLTPRTTGTGLKEYQAFATLLEFPDIDFDALYQSFTKVVGVASPCSPDFGQDHFVFQALNDITLTEYYSLDGEIECVNAEVIIVNKNGHVKLTWEPGTELPIRKGEFVIVCVYLKHPSFMEMECAVRDELRIAYDDANGGGYTRVNYSMLRRRKMLEMYLWAFKGIDTAPYCKRYYENQKFIFDRM